MNRILQYAMLLSLGIGAWGCSDQEDNQRSHVPKNLLGLEVKGPRSEANVIVNMGPAINEMNKIYKQFCVKNPKLEGCVELFLTVESNGEIGQLKITKSSMKNPEFEEAVLRPLQFMDFDGWGSPSDEDTEITVPIEFEQ